MWMPFWGCRTGMMDRMMMQMTAQQIMKGQPQVRAGTAMSVSASPDNDILRFIPLTKHRTMNACENNIQE